MTTRNVSELFLVDSSGWLEYMTDDSKATSFAHYLENESAVVVPALVIYEVYRNLAKQRGRAVADRFVSHVMHRRIVPMDDTIALAAANASIDHRLAGADAIIYATARVCQAQLVTANTHFRGLPGVIIP